MKANQKTRDNTQGVTPILGTILMLPVVMMLVSAMLLWSQSLLAEMSNSNTTLDDLEGEIRENPIELDVLLSEGNIIWRDDFEGEKQWYEEESNTLSTFDFTNSEQFYTKGHSLRITTNKSQEDYAGISKPFPKQNYGKICIEIAFTISEWEKYKTFSIYEEETINFAAVRIDIENNKLLCYDGKSEGFVSFADNLHLIKDSFSDPDDDHCWHHMRLFIDFESDHPSKDSHYIGLTLDGNYYNLRNNKLRNSSSNGISSDTVSVSYHNTKTHGHPGRVISFVDDFVFRDLEFE